MSLPYRDEYGQELAPARPLRKEDERPQASAFDRLVDSTLKLSAHVAQLVRLTYGVLVFNAVFVAFNVVLLAMLCAVLWRK